MTQEVTNHHWKFPGLDAGRLDWVSPRLLRNHKVQHNSFQHWLHIRTIWGSSKNMNAQALALETEVSLVQGRTQGTENFEKCSRGDSNVLPGRVSDTVRWCDVQYSELGRHPQPLRTTEMFTGVQKSAFLFLDLLPVKTPGLNIFHQHQSINVRNLTADTAGWIILTRA